MTMRKLMFSKKAAQMPESWRTEAGKLLWDQKPFSVQESYRHARTNLMFLPQQEDSACRKLVVTSANAGEGKSINAANLAIALAQNGKRVLLIDCDMRSPKQHRLMRYHQAPGLSEYLAGIEKTLKVHESTRAPGLAVVTAGSVPPNPAELLGAPAMRALLQRLSEHYDYLMLDMPPVNLVTDALVVKDFTDGYILVVRANRTARGELEQTLGSMEQVNAHVFGFLLNDVDPKTGKYGRYGRYGKYGKYGKYGRYDQEYGAEAAPDAARPADADAH